jgi:hypothetical protein
MRKRAAAVAVAERPDAGHVRGERIVNFNVPSCVCLDTSRIESKVVSVGPAPHRKQDVRANCRRLAFVAVDANRDTLLVWRQTDALRVGADVDTLVRQNLSYRF